MIGDPSAITNNEQKLIALEAELEEYLAAKEDPDQPFGSTRRGGELPALIRFRKWLRFFAGRTERQRGGILGDVLDGRN